MTNLLVLAAIPRKAGQGSPHPGPGFAAQAGPGRDRVAAYPAQLRQGPRRPLPILCQPASLPVLLMEWRAGMESLSPSTINVQLSAVRKLVGEARRAGMIGSE
jgi:hypothetical protein